MSRESQNSVAAGYSLSALSPFGGSYQSKNISNIFGPTHVTLVRISIVKKIRDGCGFLRLPSSPTSPSASPVIMVPVKKLVGGGGGGWHKKKEAGPAVYSGLYPPAEDGIIDAANFEQFL